jgi:hypothetical protein
LKKFSIISFVLLVAAIAAAQTPYVTVSSPTAGATLASPVQFTASAYGGSYPVTAMRIYVDGQSIYTGSASSLNTSLPLNGGSHYVVVQAWNSSGAVFNRSMQINVGSGSNSGSTTSGSGVVVSSPAAGTTVASPAQFVASATAASGRMITAMRIYVDGSSAYTVNSGSLNTSLPMANGNHNVVVQAWDNVGAVYKNTMSLNVGSSGTTTPTGSTGSTTGGISVSSPANGATVASPARFVASSAAPSGRVISAMRIYVDGTSAYTTNAASLDTSLAMGNGGHNVVVQAWDNTGAVYKNTMSLNVGSSTSSGSPSTPSTPTNSGPYASNLTATTNWLAKYTAAPDGAILYGFSYTTNQINPYYSNLAAMGYTKDPTKYGLVQNWMKWYINHLKWPDKWGLYGTTYDYTYNNGTEVSTNNADSTDSYAATFLSLAWAYYQTGDPNAKNYIASISHELDAIGGVLVKTQQSDGLTWAKPDYQIKYLMDNAEVYRGLRDLASVYQALGDSAKASYYNGRADMCQKGMNGMWMAGIGAWAVYKDNAGNLAGPNWGTWYPDATAQLFPVLYGVFPASDPRSQTVYAKFNNAWPGWPQLSFNSQDEFPWVMIGDAAALMGDTGRAGQYVNSIQSKFVSKGFPWPWYNMEAGWFVRLNNYLMGNRPF